jgi:hypothetical protein
MPDEDHHRYPNQRSVTVMVSAERIPARLAELPTRKEMFRAVLRRHDWRLPCTVSRVAVSLVGEQNQAHAPTAAVPVPVATTLIGGRFWVEVSAKTANWRASVLYNNIQPFDLST